MKMPDMTDAEKDKEIERLTFLHNLDHSLADQWQKANDEKDREIEHLREELDWKEAGGVDRITGKAWLTTRMRLEAEILELKMKLEEKELSG